MPPEEGRTSCDRPPRPADGDIGRPATNDRKPPSGAHREECGWTVSRFAGGVWDVECGRTQFRLCEGNKLAAVDSLVADGFQFGHALSAV